MLKYSNSNDLHRLQGHMRMAWQGNPKPVCVWTADQELRPATQRELYLREMREIEQRNAEITQLIPQQSDLNYQHSW